MPQPPKPLRPASSINAWFGAELRHWRQLRGLSQAELGRRVWASGSLVGKIETAERECPDGLAATLDDVLDTGGVLGRAWPLLASHQRGRAPEPSVGESPLVTLHEHAHGAAAALTAAPGDFFGGARLDVQVCRAAPERDHLRAELPDAHSDDLRAPRLVVAVCEDSSTATMAAVDPRALHRLPPAAPMRVRIPQAYALDDVTSGLLWAVSCLDGALLRDDALITERSPQLGGFAQFPRSSAGRDMVAELTPTSQKWLGSDFCARYILRQCAELDTTPDFWTRERSGEEASTWLLFAHKYAYLQDLAERFPDGMSRSFCLPHGALSPSPPAERILFLLAAALMESFGIRTHIVDDPDYSRVDGFAIEPRSTAIIASWLGTDGIWNVDTTRSTPTVREYTDVTAHARTHSITDASTPHRRLHALTQYLGLDWTWLARRCQELATHGVAGLISPSSRLLSVAGVDRACRFLAAAAPEER